MSQKFNLPDLDSGETGLHCDPSEMIEVPANFIIELTRLFERDNFGSVMEDHFNNHPGQTSWLVAVVAKYADELEQRHEKPITNRNRKYSNNQLI